ncbi:hypothetical protein MUG78_16765 [Gordonia alkaliphila]|uniref:hypothetical protein n=1 Tax=Gordonia alkaliphila TaxID=1053547 RepID=UPI001FF595FD|nr:hypothetical protein [Gordonia alkaliphila]MCK0441053.1 hypothetical protein [Gordonia alkaliphila]
MTDQLFDSGGEPTDEAWGRVRTLLEHACGVEYLVNEKIYLLMDQSDVDEAESHGSHIHPPEIDGVCAMYDESESPLRFVNAVARGEHYSVIPQYFLGEKYPTQDYPLTDLLNN